MLGLRSDKIRQRQMLTFSLAGCRSCAVFLSPDLDSQRVCRLHDITALLIRPDVAHCLAGGVNSADTLNLVIESIRPDTDRGRSPIVPVPADGAGGSPIGLTPTWFIPLLGHSRR
jgi:hypothetical protein